MQKSDRLIDASLPAVQSMAVVATPASEQRGARRAGASANDGTSIKQNSVSQCLCPPDLRKEGGHEKERGGEREGVWRGK